MLLNKNIIPKLLLPAGLTGLGLIYYHLHRLYPGLNFIICICFYASLFCVATGLLFILFGWLKTERQTQFKVLLPVFSIFAALLIAECFLRLKGINRAYIENRNGSYVSTFTPYDKNIDWHYLPGSDGFLVTPEYKYPRHHNNLGFSDADFYPKNDSNTILIQTCGDSFTEGDGAPVDSSYPALLRGLLNHNGRKKFVVQNFGVCGNDPAFCWRQLQDIGVKLKPNLIIIEYNTGDLVTDFLTRGGPERFKDGYYKTYDAPWWEWLYGISYVARLVAHSAFGIEYNNFFLTKAQTQARIEELKPRWNKTFANIANIAYQHNIKVLLVKKPEVYETTDGKYRQDLAFFDRMKDTVAAFKNCDLLPFFIDSFHINKDNSATYWWPKDMHNKGKGYAMMAEGVYAGLKQSYPEIFTTFDTIKTAK